MSNLPNILQILLKSLHYTFFSEEEVQDFGVEKWEKFEDVPDDLEDRFEDKFLEYKELMIFLVDMWYYQHIEDEEKEIEKKIYNFIVETELIKDRNFIKVFAYYLYEDYKFVCIESYVDFILNDVLKALYEDEDNKKICKKKFNTDELLYETPISILWHFKRSLIKDEKERYFLNDDDIDYEITLRHMLLNMDEKEFRVSNKIEKFPYFTKVMETILFRELLSIDSQDGPETLKKDVFEYMANFRKYYDDVPTICGLIGQMTDEKNVPELSLLSLFINDEDQLLNCYKNMISLMFMNSDKVINRPDILFYSIADLVIIHTESYIQFFGLEHLKNKDSYLEPFFKFVFYDLFIMSDIFNEDQMAIIISNFMQKLYDAYHKDERLFILFVDALVSLNNSFLVDFLKEIEIVVEITTEENVKRNFKCCVHYLYNTFYKNKIEQFYTDDE